MKYPYVSAPLDALLAAQTCAGAVMAGTLWQRGFRPRVANAALLSAVALAIVAPVGTAPFAEGHFWRSLGVVVGPHFAKPVLRTAAALATCAALLTRRKPLVATALAGQIILWLVTDCIQGSDGDLSAAHLALFGALLGVHLREHPSESPPAMRALFPPRFDDLLAGALGTLAGAITCWTVLRGWNVSADEGANTFQAGVFAKLRAYGNEPACPDAFRFFWVFFYKGRAFAQYTPGWPLFMAPFFVLGVAWLAGPVSLGLLAVGVMRLGRRAAGPESARVAGWMATAALLLSPVALINGGSRYPHVFAAAAFAWSLEALAAASRPGDEDRAKKGWAIALGVVAGWLVAARPLEGATLGLGLFASFVLALAKGRVSGRAAALAGGSFGLVGGATLVVLRLQIGTWWTTGYSLSSQWYPWSAYGWTLPPANEYHWGVPLAAAAYYAWPCSVALGLAGLALVRGPVRLLGPAVVVGCAALLFAFTLSERNRFLDFGYGPRYQLPCVVPMAVGTGVLLAGAVRLGQRAWISTGLVLGAAVAGVLMVAPFTYPYTRQDVEERNWLHPLIDGAGLHNAVVLTNQGLHNDARDIAENLPIDLYPDQDVLLALDTGDDAVRCVREHYPGRVLYRATAGPPARIARVEGSP